VEYNSEEIMRIRIKIRKKKLDKITITNTWLRDKILCIKSMKFEITEGKYYTIVDSNERNIVIINDRNSVHAFSWEEDRTGVSVNTWFRKEVNVE